MKKVNHKFLFLALVFSVFGYPLLGQYIPDPSFEGTPGFSVCPPLWEPCDSQSTPDTGPVGPTHITQSASSGETYLVLVTRGDDVRASRTEDIETLLYKPLQLNTDYELSMDLAMSGTAYVDTGKSGKLWLNNPVKLRIYGGVTGCEKTELLAESGAVNNTDWKNYSFTIHPTLSDYNYLILQAYFVQLPVYYGNILVDNISIKNDKPVDESFIPNVITPNGDGHNDVFFIENLIRDCDLAIFDRWGNLIYHTSNYDNSWDGKKEDGTPLESGTYWYVIKFPDKLGTRKGSIYIKRK